MKKTLCAIVLLALLASPVFAQGPFTDVPTDHWAYQAVDQLVRDGIIVGYPDGTFGGKRAMTRFEFAQALARAIPVIVDQASKPAPPTPLAGVSQAEVDAVKARVATLEAAKPEVTKADLALIQKMADEFKDELTAMGVDLDALKRDVADLNKRVTAVEAEQDRIRISGAATVFAIGDKFTVGAPVDRDLRSLTTSSEKLLEGIRLVRDLDLNITAKAGDNAKVVASINAGNYLNYLNGSIGSVDTDSVSTDDQFTPYYLYAQMALGSGSVTVGRQPIQWTPYTLKMIDVDTYTDNAKTDSGDFPLDGISGAWKLGGVGVQAFAAKADTNPLLQPDTAVDFGGLEGMGELGNVDQLAGVRVTLGTPMKGNLGLSYLQSGGSGSATYDQATTMGADLNLVLGKFTVGAEYAKVKSLATSSTVADLADDSTALDANVGFDLGKIGIKAGWKKIEEKFDALGAWDHIGTITNPKDVQGEYADVKFGLADTLDLTVCAEFLKGIGDTGPSLTTDDKINYYKAGLKWGLASKTNINFGYEWLKYNPATAGVADTVEKFVTIGLGHQFTPNASMSLKYHIIEFNDDDTSVLTGSVGDAKGDLAVAQFQVKF